MRPFLAFKILLFTLIVPGAVLIYLPYYLLSDPGNWQTVNAVWAIPAGFCILLGLAIYLRCAWDFAIAGLGTPARLSIHQKNWW
ncbi:hypothetical protein [Methylomonas fluvii]|uniref:hypothetical protein n=1 Tax=Methylomonas fluvii TaxID=1854564 RepID=UPI001E581B97|nr:hypothetical protein [Methylomonas fluvii]